MKVYKIVVILIVVLLAVGALASIVKLTNGFSNSLNSYYVSIDGNVITNSAYGYVIGPNGLSVDVSNFSVSGSLISVSVVGNKNCQDKLYVDGQEVSLSSLSDCMAGFELNSYTNGFTIKARGDIVDVFELIFPDKTIELLSYSYTDCMTLVISNGNSDIYVDFSLIEHFGFEQERYIL